MQHKIHLHLKRLFSKYKYHCVCVCLSLSLSLSLSPYLSHTHTYTFCPFRSLSLTFLKLALFFFDEKWSYLSWYISVLCKVVGNKSRHFYIYLFFKLSTFNWNIIKKNFIRMLFWMSFCTCDHNLHSTYIEQQIFLCIFIKILDYTFYVHSSVQKKKSLFCFNASQFFKFRHLHFPPKNVLSL